MNKFYTAQEIAEKLKIKKTTVYELIKRGELKSSKIGKQLRISDAQLEEYLHASSQTEEPALSPPESKPESSLLKREYLLNSSGLILSGQNSPALEILLSQMALHAEEVSILQSHMNTYNGLYSLYFGKVHLASASLSPDKIQTLIPGIPLTALQLYEYPMGFYVQKGNPKQIQSVQDLTKSDVIFANREKGSTRRMYLDETLKLHSISPSEISGYARELVSDFSTAAFVSSHKADAALGEKYTAQLSPCLDFVPLCTMPMFLVMERAVLHNPNFSSLIRIVQSEEFKAEIRTQTGYKTAHTGELLDL